MAELSTEFAYLAAGLDNLGDADVAMVERAYLLSERAHEGQLAV